MSSLRIIKIKVNYRKRHHAVKQEAEYRIGYILPSPFHPTNFSPLKIMLLNSLNSCERVAEWLRRLTRKPKVRTVVGSNPTLDSLVAVRNTSPGQPEPCEGNLVAIAGSCGGLMVKHRWPLLEVSQTFAG